MTLPLTQAALTAEWSKLLEEYESTSLAAPRLFAQIEAAGQALAAVIDSQTVAVGPYEAKALDLCADEMARLFCGHERGPKLWAIVRNGAEWCRRLDARLDCHQDACPIDPPCAKHQIAALTAAREELRDSLNASCACRHDGRGGLDSECQAHAEQREDAARLDCGRDACLSDPPCAKHQIAALRSKQDALRKANQLYAYYDSCHVCEYEFEPLPSSQDDRHRNMVCSKCWSGVSALRRAERAEAALAAQTTLARERLERLKVLPRDDETWSDYCDRRAGHDQWVSRAYMNAMEADGRELSEVDEAMGSDPFDCRGHEEARLARLAFIEAAKEKDARIQALTEDVSRLSGAVNSTIGNAALTADAYQRGRASMLQETIEFVSHHSVDKRAIMDKLDALVHALQEPTPGEPT